MSIGKGKHEYSSEDQKLQVFTPKQIQTRHFSAYTVPERGHKEMMCYVGEDLPFQIYKLRYMLRLWGQQG